MSIQISPVIDNGCCYFHAPAWTARGVLHGFFCRELNAAEMTHLAPVPGLPGNFGPLPLSLLKQVHGTEIQLENAQNERPIGDGWLIDTSDSAPGLRFAFAVQSADCFPVFILDVVRRECLLLHAGWRGIVAGIVPHGVSLLRQRGSVVGDLEALVGPAAQSCCYEVGDDVLAELRKWELRVKVSLSAAKNGRNFARLQALIRAQLQAEGVLSGGIGELGVCTICDSRFFSYRREKALAGRQLSIVVGRVAYKNP